MTPFHVLLAVFVPVFVTAQVISTSNSTCALGGHTFFNEYGAPEDCLLRTGDTYMKKIVSTTGCTNATTRDYFKKCLNATKCLRTLKSMKSEKIQQNLNASIEILYEIMDFAFADNKYQVFVSNNGIDCVNRIRPEIKKCVAKAIYGHEKNDSKHNSTDSSSRLNSTTVHHHETQKSNETVNCKGLLIVNLEKSGGCHETKELKSCVEKALKNETTSCKPEHNNFVTSLFDFVTDKYCKNRTSIVKGNSSSSAYSTTHVMFLFITVLLTLPIFM